jgi:integrase
MDTLKNDTTAGAKSVPKTKEQRLSTDGLWRYFPKVQNLIQYVPSGVYFARIKFNGKAIRKSLETNVWTTAKLKLPDAIREVKKPKAAVGTFAEARLLYESDLSNDHAIKPESKRYRIFRIAALLKTWPSLDATNLRKITVPECKEWAKRFSEKFDAQNFNNTLGTLRAILERGGLGHDENPAYKIDRLGVRPPTLVLPEPEQFQRLLAAVETAGSRHSHNAANLIRFLAYSGCRIGEARKVTWADVDFDHGTIKVWNGKRSRRSNQAETRLVPIIPAMRQFLEKLRQEQLPQSSDRICLVGECEKALTAACGCKDGERLTRVKRGKEIQLGIGIERITHHDLRHLFASVCIESGIDIPTISRWLGHSDGGALAMRVYGHLRQKHSQEMASKVMFGAAPLPDNVLPMQAAVGG